MRRTVLLLIAAAWLAPPVAAFAEARTIPRADGVMVPVRLAGDWAAPGCPPVLILSHGLGGDERALGWMDAAAAAAGFRVLAMAHAASGPAALRQVARAADRVAALHAPAIWAGRAADLDAAVAFATAACRPAPFVLGGHSMGAALTMAEAGAAARFPYVGRDRFDAYIAVSPQGEGWAIGPAAWAGVRRPVLMMTGTRDDGPDGNWTTRLAAFDGLPPGRKRLAVIAGATHLDLGGRRMPAPVRDAAPAVAAAFLPAVRRGGPQPGRS